MDIVEVDSMILQQEIEDEDQIVAVAEEEPEAEN